MKENMRINKIKMNQNEMKKSRSTKKNEGKISE